MKMKKALALLLTATMMMTCMVGCGSKEDSETSAAKSSQSETSDAGDGEIKEFTAFFATPGSEINDDN